MKKSSYILVAYAVLSLSACGAPTTPTPSSSSTPSPTSSPTPTSTPAEVNTQNWTETQITAYADCLDAQFPKDQIATTARVNLAGIQTQKSRLSAEVYQLQLDGIGKILISTEANRGTLLPGKPSGCETKIGR